MDEAIESLASADNEIKGDKYEEKSSKSANKNEEFDKIFELVGGHGKFQYFLLAITSIQSCILVFHHLGYIFLGHVPRHNCKIDDFDGLSTWSAEQIKNISIPWTRNENQDVYYDSCHYNDLDYNRLLTYHDTFESAYKSVNFSQIGKKYCSNWEYDNSTYISTIVTEFNLVCNYRYLVATIQASYMVGVLFGSVIMGSLSDEKLGRRKAVLISIIMIILGGFGASIKFGYWLFLGFRFIIAAGVAGSFQNAFVLLLEHSDPECRAFLGIIEQLPFAIGYMILPLFGYYIRDWVSLQIAFSLTTLILLIYFWLLPESPRWLATRGQLDEAFDRFAAVAQMNGKPPLNREYVMEILKSCARGSKNDSNDRSNLKTRVFEEIQEEIPKDDKLSLCKNSFLNFFSSIWRNLGVTGNNYWYLIKTPEIRRRTLTIWVLFASVALVYYGVVFDSPSLTTDPFLMIFLMGIIEVPAYSLIIPFVSKYGRRPTVVITFILTGFSSLIISFVSFDHEIIRIVLSLLSKFNIASCFAIIYLLAAELFPTSVRTTGLGSAVLMGRFGSILAPYVVDGMNTVYRDMPSIINGIFSLSAGIVALFFLPETMHEDLKDQVDELEDKNAAGKRRFSLVEGLPKILNQKNNLNSSNTTTTTCTKEKQVCIELNNQ